MRIAVLGGGAMGALFGGYLSRGNEVILVDVSAALVEKVRADGVTIQEPDGGTAAYQVQAMSQTGGQAPVDLMIIFVKAMFSHSALEQNRGMIGPDTYLMTLQNGSGHEQTLLEFVDEDHVIIGTTQHNSAVIEPGVVRHGGSGLTHIGSLSGAPGRLAEIAGAMTACGLETDCSANIQKLIWEKLFTNVSASVLTAVLQVPLGFIASDPNAWSVCERLVREAVDVANADGMGFDAQQKVDEVRQVCLNSPLGLTSIYADIRDGRKSEVDTISGSVVRASRRNKTPAPTHEAVVALVKALEAKAAKQ